MHDDRGANHASYLTNSHFCTPLHTFAVLLCGGHGARYASALGLTARTVTVSFTSSMR
jgi:hypothetical protein